MSDVKLIGNLHTQVTRLVSQLEELEQEKNELTEDEYKDMKSETVEELNEISRTLEKMSIGEVSSVDTNSRQKQAIRETIAKAFQSIHGTQALSKKSIAILRQKLTQVSSDYSLKKINEDTYRTRRVAVLSKLDDLGDVLSTSETADLKESLAQVSLSLKSASTNSKAKDEFIDSL